MLRSLPIAKSGRNSLPRKGKFAGLQAAGASVSMGPLGGSQVPFKFRSGQHQGALTTASAPQAAGRCVQPAAGGD